MSSENEPQQRGQATSSGSGLGRLYTFLAVVAVIGVGVIGYTVGRETTQTATAPVTIEGIDDPARLSELAAGMSMGDDDATVTIIEFGDHQCPACAAFALTVKPQVESALIETGKAKFVFYDFPLVGQHPHAFLASRAARCADDQGRFWDYHDHLFRTQPRWSALTDAAPMFEQFASTLDLDTRAFGQCLNSDRHAELVSANLALAQALQVPQTPTILIEHDGTAERVVSDFASIEARVNELLGS